MTVSMEVKGLGEANRFVNKKLTAVKNKLPSGMLKVSLHLQNEVKESIAGRKAEPRSVDTGRLMNSVDKEVRKENAKIFTNVPYGPFIEFGTSRFTGRKHFTNSAARNQKKVGEILGEEVKLAVKLSI